MEEVEHLELYRAQLRLEDLHHAVTAQQVVALDAAEELHDTRGARGGQLRSSGYMRLS